MDSDDQIIAAVLAGDRERFTVLVDRHGRALLGYLRRRVPAEEARELFQETVVRSFEGLAGLREPGRFRAWMITIASNTLRKRRRRIEPLPLDEVGAAGATLAPDDADRLQGAEERARIERAVASLPARQREVFELRAVQELTHAEIAALLDIREENARANYYQAVRKLRAQLEDESN